MITELRNIRELIQSGANVAGHSTRGDVVVVVEVVEVDVGVVVWSVVDLLCVRQGLLHPRPSRPGRERRHALCRDSAMLARLRDQLCGI